MPKEIERKFLIEPEAWRKLNKPAGKHYKQGYIPGSDEVTTRIRVANSKGYLTLKGKTVGISRDEFEYEVPYNDAIEMINSFTNIGTEKIRYEIPIDNVVWEVDEFLGDNAGLIVAEIELKNEDQTFNIPSWIGQEVTNDSRYFNFHLAIYPYRDWDN